MSRAMLFVEEFNSLSYWDRALAPQGTWRTDYGYGGNADYSFNDELQHYTGPYYRDHLGDFNDGNFKISTDATGNGVLSLVAHKTTNAEVLSQGYGYTSGMITTRGAEPWYGGPTNQFAFQYGYVEMRANPSDEPGAWNAFWLLPSAGDANGWKYAEVDIMESVGKERGQVFQAVHGAVENGAYATVNVLGDGFHTFGLEWTAEKMTWFIDGQATRTITTPSDMHQPMILIANQAVGGSWAGTPDFGADGVSEFKIDYIRVYGPEVASAPAPAPVVVAPALEAGRVLTGTKKADTLAGATGADTINGGDAADHITGGAGNDKLTGGKGDDSFYFSAGFGQDVITDLNASAREDRLILDKSLGTMSVAEQWGGTLVSFASGDSIMLTGVKRADFGNDDWALA